MTRLLLEASYEKAASISPAHEPMTSRHTIANSYLELWIPFFALFSAVQLPWKTNFYGKKNTRAQNNTIWESQDRPGSSLDNDPAARNIYVLSLLVRRGLRNKQCRVRLDRGSASHRKTTK